MRRGTRYTVTKFPAFFVREGKDKMNRKEVLSEAIRGVLARGQYKMDDPGAPFSGMADLIAEQLWEQGYRQGPRSGGPLEYTLVRETDAGDVVLVPPRWGGDLEDVFEFLHYNDGMRPDMSIRYRHAEMWDELDPYWWEDKFEDYQKERSKIYERG